MSREIILANFFGILFIGLVSYLFFDSVHTNIINSKKYGLNHRSFCKKTAAKELKFLKKEKSIEFLIEFLIFLFSSTTFLHLIKMLISFWSLRKDYYKFMRIKKRHR